MYSASTTGREQQAENPMGRRGKERREGEKEVSMLDVINRVLSDSFARFSQLHLLLTLVVVDDLGHDGGRRARKR